MLKIKFLGEISVEYDGEDIGAKFGGKTIALLCILVLNYGKTLSREKITTYLWPDSNEEAAKYNLRYNLWTIKKHIGVDSNDNDFLNIARDRCGINNDYEYECDIKYILELNKCKHITLEKLEEAYGMFKGDFMEGCFFNKCNELNEIIIFERNRFEDLKVHVLKELLARYTDKDMYKAEGALKAILEIDPYDEDSAYRLMEIYEKRGKRGSAIIFYGEFKNRMITYLGIQPSVELKKKYEKLKSEQISDKEEKTEFVNTQNDEKITVKTKCMKSVGCFWISDVLRKLDMKKPGIINENMNPSQLYNLKTIQPNIVTDQQSNISVNANKVSIVNSFIELMLKISDKYNLTIEIKNIDAMDAVSGEVYEYLRDEDIKFIIR